MFKLWRCDVGKHHPYEGGAFYYGPSMLHRHQLVGPAERRVKLHRLIRHAESQAAAGLRLYAAMVPVLKAELVELNAQHHQDPVEPDRRQVNLYQELVFNG